MAVVIKHMTANGYTELSSKDWGNVVAGASSTAEKFFIWNVGDRDLTGLIFDVVQTGTTDGYLYMRWAQDLNTLSCPWGVGATVLGSGGSIAAGVKYFYRMTGLNASGETTVSVEVSATASVSNSSFRLDWTALPSASGYKIYRSTSSGSYGATSLLTTIGSGTTTSYTDTGIALSSGTPPTANTTGGGAPAYGTAPTLAETSITIGTLEVGRQFIYWMGVSVPASVPETGNPRNAQRRFRET